MRRRKRFALQRANTSTEPGAEVDVMAGTQSRLLSVCFEFEY